MMQNDRNLLEFVQYEGSVPFVLIMHDRTELLQQGRYNPRLMEHWHQELEINYGVEGMTEYCVNGKEYVMQGGQFIVINSESIHSIRIYPEAVSLQQPSFTLQIDNHFLKSILPDIHEKYFSMEHIRSDKRIKEILHEIYRCGLEKQGNYWKIILLSLICELLYELCAQGALQDKSEIPINSQKNIERLRGIMQYVTEHYQEELNQDIVAKRFYFSRGYFSKFFKEYTGITFKEYVTRYRLELAEKYLMEEALSVTQAAMKAGFTDTRRFILAFKSAYGVTPYQYKLQMTKR